ncbi:Glycosyltransferase involved in cell wall bisynthesis [Pseudovibrio ascidiaceicola]|uniref:Glycosyltransferase involved in cell wall bisynthesis n=1 Tax=Pseudovibrio ascidiaceicola TaxID=285279 RepID=A0A1I4ECY7_9HYPH|nr:glycosyltransferase family 4 protein [Pseudovibrio ascidiaceicola]SFL02226.1 Glycosyltransferase involved in cell wall bisynthesis [Pseudovibrio ascidiaceicola]
MRILLVANSSFKLINFRRTLIEQLLREGHELIAAAPRDDYTPDFKKMGVRYIELPMDATGTSVVAELKLLLRIFGITRRYRPDAALGFTIKPNIYGALSARLLGIPFVPNITGMGSVFDRDDLFARLIKGLYRSAFRRCPRVFLQNPEDLAFFVKTGLISKEQACLLPGSGVDLTSFHSTALPGNSHRRTFTLVARMLREKGVLEFVEAARALSPNFPDARFVLLGPSGSGKAGALSEDDMKTLTADGVVEYLGSVKDVRPVVADADCVVLPSYYREGTPRSLLEAAAMGRPIITTTIPGCKDVVDEGQNGFLCEPRSTQSIETAMRQFLLMSETAINEMGHASRKKAEQTFDERIVVDHYTSILQATA